MRISFDMEFKDAGEFQAFLEIVKGERNSKELIELAEKLKVSTDQLENVLTQNGVKPMTAGQQNLAQANPGLEQLRANVERMNTVATSAVTLIAGIPGLIQNAVNQALANGATAEELQPVLDLGTQLGTNADALAAAVAANTPTPPPEPPQT